MRKPLVILVLAMCTTFLASADAQDTCGSPTTAPGDSTSPVFSNLGALYFYPSAFDPSCVGTVVAYEFCYKHTQTSGEGAPEDVVSILVLESVGENYRVVWTGDEREDHGCTTDGLIQGVVRCCGTTDLVAAGKMFPVGTNHGYGFVIPGSTQNVLLTLTTSAPGYILAAPALISDPDNLPAVNSTLTPVDLGLSGMQLQNLQRRSVQFIIQPPSPDPSPTPGSSLTPDPVPTPDSNVIPDPKPPSPTDTPDPGTTDPSTTDPGTTDPSTTDPSSTDPSTTDPNTTDPSTTRDANNETEDRTSIVTIVVPTAVGASLLTGITVVILMLFVQHKKQKTFVVSEQLERNEAYLTNINSIPAAQNKAYGVTKLEGGNTLNREDTADGAYYDVNQLGFDELSEPHTQQEDDMEHTYEYVP